MRIGILVNVMDSTVAGATSYRLAAQCVNLGHDVWVMSAGGLCYNPDDSIGAFARRVPPGQYDSATFLDALGGDSAVDQDIRIDELDVLLLRSNPSVQQGWAQDAGIHFGRLAMRRGVIVLNDPNGLSKAMNKLYLQTFPETVRPRTLVTRSIDRIAAFANREGRIIIKPLQGAGGKGVFIVRGDRLENLEGIIRSVSRDGYVIAQEYLPAASDGDTRLFLMNGLPLQHNGSYAAFRRVRTGDDIRSNIHAGGRIRKAEIDDSMLRLAEIVRPRLVQDGMFLVGLDIVGDKLMEINVFTPGGLGSAERLENVDFTAAVVESIEHKVRYMSYYRRQFSNLDMATL